MLPTQAGLVAATKSSSEVVYWCTSRGHTRKDLTTRVILQQQPNGFDNMGGDT